MGVYARTEEDSSYPSKPVLLFFLFLSKSHVETMCSSNSSSTSRRETKSGLNRVLIGCDRVKEIERSELWSEYILYFLSVICIFRKRATLFKCLPVSWPSVSKVVFHKEPLFTYSVQRQYFARQSIVASIINISRREGVIIPRRWTHYISNWWPTNKRKGTNSRMFNGRNEAERNVK